MQNIETRRKLNKTKRPPDHVSDIQYDMQLKI